MRDNFLWTLLFHSNLHKNFSNESTNFHLWSTQFWPFVFLSCSSSSTQHNESSSSNNFNFKMQTLNFFFANISKEFFLFFIFSSQFLSLFLLCFHSACHIFNNLCTWNIEWNGKNPYASSWNWMVMIKYFLLIEQKIAKKIEWKNFLNWKIIAFPSRKWLFQMKG